MKCIWYFTAADQAACYSTFFTVRRTNKLAFPLHSEKSVILCWLVRAEHVNCCDEIIEMMRTRFRKFYFCPTDIFTMYLTHGFNNNRKTVLMEMNSHYSAGKWISLHHMHKRIRPMHKRGSPFPTLQHLSLVLEEHSHRGSEFKNQIFWL